VPTSADRGCHVVSVTDLYGLILGFLDRTTDALTDQNKGFNLLAVSIYGTLNVPFMRVQFIQIILYNFRNSFIFKEIENFARQNYLIQFGLFRTILCLDYSQTEGPFMVVLA
jgi:hypothetical protein